MRRISIALILPLLLFSGVAVSGSSPHADKNMRVEPRLTAQTAREALMAMLAGNKHSLFCSDDDVAQALLELRNGKGIAVRNRDGNIEGTGNWHVDLRKRSFDYKGIHFGYYEKTAGFWQAHVDGSIIHFGPLNY